MRKRIKEIDNFYGKCGKKQQQKAVTEKKEVKTLSYKHLKREEQAGHFKPSKSSTSTSAITKESEPRIQL